VSIAPSERHLHLRRVIRLRRHLWSFAPIGASIIAGVVQRWRLNLKLEDLEIYQMSMGIGETIWLLVREWDYLSKKTIGMQLH
jgi:hypothetical protein